MIDMMMQQDYLFIRLAARLHLQIFSERNAIHCFVFRIGCAVSPARFRDCIASHADFAFELLSRTCKVFVDLMVTRAAWSFELTTRSLFLNRIATDAALQ